MNDPYSFLICRYSVKDLLKYSSINAVPVYPPLELYPRNDLCNVLFGNLFRYVPYNSMHENSHLVKIVPQSVGATKGGGSVLTSQDGVIIPKNCIDNSVFACSSTVVETSDHSVPNLCSEYPDISPVHGNTKNQISLFDCVEAPSQSK